MFLMLFLLTILTLIHADNVEISKQLGYEGSILLENKNEALPLSIGSKIAVFGINQNDFIKGGGGSGDVNVAYSHNLVYGLQEKEAENKISLFNDLIIFYQKCCHGGEPRITDEMMNNAREFADVAIITFGRTSTEREDRSAEKGDYLLSDRENELVSKVLAQNFSKVIVILNVGGIIDSSWYKSVPGIDAVLVVWQPGMEGGGIMADLLVGDAYPSGKLIDTFAKNYEDYPSAASFGESLTYVNYEEDIFVGYRYFETIPNASEKVNYEFGFGLSYTTFSIDNVTAKYEPAEEQEQKNREKQHQRQQNSPFQTLSFSQSSPTPSLGSIVITATVRNTGARPGKEVVQVYYSAPQGKLGKPAKVLAGFVKTGELTAATPATTEKRRKDNDNGNNKATSADNPDTDTEIVTIRFPVESMASYDDLGKVQEAAWVLEEGEYRFFVGSSVRKGSLVEGFAYVVEKDVVTKQLEHAVVPSKLRKRMLADGTFEELPDSSGEMENGSGRIKENGKERKEKKMEKEALYTAHNLTLVSAQAHTKKNSHNKNKSNNNVLSLKDVAADPSLMSSFVTQLSIDDLIHLSAGVPGTNPYANTGGIGDIPQYGIPNVHTADGPAGARLDNANTTAWPVETLIASMWNPSLAYEYAGRVADELVQYNLGIWLAPALNIHRDPLCGRNFEYYSEDPLLAGKTGAAVVRGTQSRNVSAVVKHFAANGKEENRRGSDSRVSERALREIYLRNFEIAVREGEPWSLMTSYNLLNGIKASERADLLIKIVREEWGFTGVTMTDWANWAPHCLEAVAGSDIKMPVGEPDNLRAALANGSLTREDLERNVKDELNMIIKTRVFADSSFPSITTTAPKKQLPLWSTILIAAVGAVLTVAIIVILIVALVVCYKEEEKKGKSESKMKGKGKRKVNGENEEVESRSTSSSSSFSEENTCLLNGDKTSVGGESSSFSGNVIND